MKVGSGIALFLALTVSLAAMEPGGRLKVVTTFLPLYCFTAHVAGTSADVENLLPGNVSPHEYQFARSDLRKLEKADLIVVNGAGMETWLHRLLQNSGSHHAVAVATSGMEEQFIHGSPSLGSSAQRDGEQVNPHLWLDPVLARQIVTNILQALEKADPAQASAYRANAAKYIGELEKLDREFQTTLAAFQEVPFVTLHDAFPYLARRYRLRLTGVLEQVPDVDPSAKYLHAFQGVIRQEKVRVLFTEKGDSSRLARQLAKDLDLKLADLDTLETGPIRKDAYELAMQRNLKTLAENLTSPTHAHPSEKK